MDINEVHKVILDLIPNKYQKSEGFPAYDLTRAMAAAIAELYGYTDQASLLSDVDCLAGDDLDKWVKQRKGIYRKQATNAAGKIKIVNGNGTINAGDLFATASGLQYQATESKTVSTGDLVAIQAVTAGKIGNVPAETVIYMPVTIEGIVSVTNPEEITGGYDEEDDESLRNRYYTALAQPATSGNKNHYIQWAEEVHGVGLAKCIPLWNGDNTVKVVITSDTMQAASAELIKAVQDHIDPEKSGTGQGEAPIGAYCTVVSATPINITVTASITLATGYDKASVKTNIQNEITDYLKSVAFKTSYISYAKIGNAIMSADGVLDYENLKVNNGTANISVGEYQVAVLGGVTI
jgi:uncharacterized phage protein gp47/JayE